MTEYEFNKENFDKIINEFQKLNTDTKKEKIIEDLKFLINYQTKLCELNNKKMNVIESKEINAFNPKISNENDFLKVVYAYLYMLKNANYEFICALSKNIMNINDIWQ